MKPTTAAVALALAAAAPAALAAERATCAGGETLQAAASAWAAALAPRTQVRIDPAARLSAEGFAQLLAGQAQCVLYVREPFPSELAAFRARFGHEPTLVAVGRGSYATRGGTHALAIYVNAANPIGGLTLGQIERLFSAAPTSGPTIHTWGDLGLTGAWATRPVRLYGMLRRRASGDPPGVVNFLQLRVLHGAPIRSDQAEEVDRPGEQALGAIVRQVAEDPDGIGYSGFGYARAGARAAPISEGDGKPFVTGSPRSVADGSYPLTRRIYILYDRPPGAPVPPAIRRLVSFALSARGQAMLARDREGFLPLTRAERRAERAKLR